MSSHKVDHNNLLQGIDSLPHHKIIKSIKLSDCSLLNSDISFDSSK